MIVLGIESSCDETAAAIYKNGVILSSIVLSQEVHKLYGGVVPEIASREHDTQITNIVQQSLVRADVSLSEIDGIAVTYGAGLMGALLVGLNFAKGLSIALDIPFIGVNHLEGHLYASFLSYPEMKYPYLCLLVTGGHTQIWEVKNPGDYVLHSNTVDDAAGEAFDKGARILGLGYPGGPEIEKCAKNGDSRKYSFPIPRVRNNPLNFSFSGLKTSLLYKTKVFSNYSLNQERSNIAASYQDAIINSLIFNLDKVISLTSINRVSIVGGVAANQRFRDIAKELSVKNNLEIYFPSLEFCTDNAAMIAISGYEKLKNNIFSSLSLKANPSLALDDSSFD